MKILNSYSSSDESDNSTQTLECKIGQTKAKVVESEKCGVGNIILETNNLLYYISGEYYWGDMYYQDEEVCLDSIVSMGLKEICGISKCATFWKDLFQFSKADAIDQLCN